MRRQPFHIQLLDLILIQLTNWRWSWRMTVITGMIAPVFSTIAIGAFASRGGEDKLFILSGNIVLSLLFVSMGNVSGHFVFMRFTGRLDFFATLPIYRTTLIFATVIAFFLLNLPAVLATLIAGVLILDVPLHIHPLILVVIPLISISLSGLGALIGISVRTLEQEGAITNITTFIMLGMGPVLIPPDHLPAIIKSIGFLSPATYAAAALRQTLFNHDEAFPLALNIFALIIITTMLLWIVNRKMEWRQQ